MQRVDGARDNTAWLRLERGEKVPDMVARRILQDIVDRGLSAGDSLPSEALMVEQFGVGRASLREALRILETHDLIRIKAGPRGGPVVTEASTAAYGRVTSLFMFRAGAVYRDLLAARLVIEPIMARLAAERLNDDTAQRLKEVVEEGEAAVDGSPNTWALASERFHALVAAMSGNLVLDMYAGALIGIERRQIGAIITRGDRDEELKVHARIAKAILGGDGAAAERLTRRHIEEEIRLMESKHQSRLDERIAWS